MPTVLAIAPGTPPALEGRNLLADGLVVELRSNLREAIAHSTGHVCDLLVLSGMTVDEQQSVAARFQQDRRWRLVPVLYLQLESSPGIAIPSGYRPEIDSLARGAIDSPAVLRRMRAMARDGTSSAELVVAGACELDPLRGRLRFAGHEVSLTDREAEILALLLSHPNRTVSASEIIERGWGTEADDRYLQILRRHVSNIRRKLDQTPAARSVRTVRGSGYRFDIRLAG
ncbi:MAG: winged helix-turn-helix domain-containing protein [Dehalococcoidia bacterium]|nr:winged helix-turn-helix domain-containing protein [Dehalococcoidia bacterium]